MPSERRALLLILLAAVLWGTSFSVNDVGLRYEPPGTLAFFRFLWAAVATVGLAWATGRMDWSLGRRPVVWVLGLLNALGFLFQYLGQELTTPARTSLFVNLDVLWVALLSLALLGERFTRGKALAVPLAVVGAVLLEVGSQLAAGAGVGTLLHVLVTSPSARGDALVLLGGVAWAGYMLLNKRMVDLDVPVLGLLAWTFTATAVFLAPAALAEGALPSGAVGWGAVLYTGLVCTTAAYGLWSLGLRHVTATVSAIVLLVEIGVAMVVSLALGRETFTALAAAGAALVVVAIVLATRDEEGATPEHAPPAATEPQRGE